MCTMAHEKRFRDLVEEMTPKEFVLANLQSKDIEAFRRKELGYSRKD